jgi:hypothetical protein
MNPRHFALPLALTLASFTPAGCGPAIVGPEEAEEAEGVNTDGEPDPWSEVQGTDGEQEPGREISSCSMSSGIANGNYTRLTYLSVAKLARSVGIGCGYNLVKAVAVAGAESGRYQYAYLRNKNCSYDRGIWQINGGYWGSYSTYNQTTNAKGMYVISGHGTKWSPWVAYNKGLWWSFRSSACAAVKSLCGKSYC